MNITQEEVEKLLQNMSPLILEGLKTDITNTIKTELTWAAKDEISSYVRGWIKENILPEIGKELEQGKDGLLNIGMPLAEKAMTELKEALLLSLTESLSRSYSRNEIFKKMFGG